MKKLEKEINVLRDKYLSIPLKEIDIGAVFDEIFNLAFSYNIVIPSEFTMLSKSLITLEGVVEKLDPELNIMEIAEPIAKKLMFSTFSPEKVGVEIIGGILDYGKLIRELPSVFLGFLKKVEEDEFSLQFKVNGIERIEKRFERVFNRISFSIVLLAVSIIIAGIAIGAGISGNVYIYTLSNSVFQVGLFIAGGIIVTLIVSMVKSTRLK